jgi:hypothetical protein
MMLRASIAPILSAVLLGATAAPALAAPAGTPAPRSCFRPDTAPPGKSLVTVRVIKCEEARQISENAPRSVTPDTPRVAAD